MLLPLPKRLRLTRPPVTVYWLTSLRFQTDYANLSTRNVTTTSSSQASGTYRLVLADLTLSASGSVGPFRYIYLYNDSPTAPFVDPLIGYFDYGSSLTLAQGESLTIDFDQASGALTLA